MPQWICGRPPAGKRMLPSLSSPPAWPFVHVFTSSPISFSTVQFLTPLHHPILPTPWGYQSRWQIRPALEEIGEAAPAADEAVVSRTTRRTQKKLGQPLCAVFSKQPTGVGLGRAADFPTKRAAARTPECVNMATVIILQPMKMKTERSTTAGSGSFGDIRPLPRAS